VGIAAEDLSGRWNSNWGAVTLSGTGATVSGTWAEGGVDGSIAGETLSLRWTHRTGTSGKANLAVGADGKTLSGSWGFDDKDAGEGDWTLTLAEAAARAPAPTEAPAEETAPEAPAADAAAEAAPAEEPKADGKKKK
jgi:hypothetical protein